MRALITLAFLATFWGTLFAQPNPAKTLSLNNGLYSFPDNSVQRFIDSKEDFQLAAFQSNTYNVLVKLDGHMTKSELNLLKEAGIETYSYLGNNTYRANIDKSISKDHLQAFGIEEIGIVPSFAKVANAVQEATTELVDLTIRFQDKVEIKTVLDALKAKGATNFYIESAAWGMVDFTFPTAKIEELAAMAMIDYIQLNVGEMQPMNYNGNGSIRSGMMGSSGFHNAYNLTGKGVYIGVGDAGEVIESNEGGHIDRNPMIENETSGTLPGWGYHGDHIVGSIAGLGNLSPWHKGVAPFSSIITEKASSIINRFSELYDAYGMTITNNSYGPTPSACSDFGVYDTKSQQIDDQLYNTTDALHVFAAGNSGNDPCGYLGYRTVLQSYASSKNALVVGAVKHKRRTIETISSRGPVQDGRIKPEIMAPGTNIQSTAYVNQYYALTGTSMASAHVTGGLSLISEAYKNIHGSNIDGGLLKTIALNTAQDKGNVGPDYQYGFGVMNVREAVEAVKAENYIIDEIADGQSNTHTLSVPAGAEEVRVMLYWVDKPGDPAASVALTNDLDLTVSKGATSYQPWVLDHLATNVTKEAVRGTDRLNNVEQVTFVPNESGDFTITVNGFDIPFGPQRYYISYEVKSPSICMTFPYGGEVTQSNSVEVLRWDAFGIVKDEVTMHYSIDAGNSWTEVPANKTFSDEEQWNLLTLPNVNTSKALMKINIDGTEVSDMSDAFFTIAGIPTNLSTTTSCNGTVKLNWDKIADVEAYEVMQLDTTMKVVKTTTKNAAVITGLSAGKEYWFTVRAKLTDGGVGRPATAINQTVSASPCISGNDIAVEAITSPSTDGRANTSLSKTATEKITIQLVNLGFEPVSNFPVSYQINGGTVVTETYTGTLKAGECKEFGFATRANLLAANTYTIDAWTALTNDVNTTNDHAEKNAVIRQIENNPVQLPITMTFEEAGSEYATENKMGFAGIDPLDVSTTAENGRFRLAAGNGFTDGNRAMTMDAAFNDNKVLNEMILTYNMSNENSGVLFFDFHFMHHGQEADADNGVYLRGNDTSPWIKIYDLDANQGAPGVYAGLEDPIDLVSELNLAGQTLSASTQIKFVQAGFSNAIDPGKGDGYTFDNIRISSSALPVELVSFHAVAVDNKDALLTWVTATEVENKGFEIQVAVNDEDFLNEVFKPISYIEGAGNSTNTIEYSFKDIGVNYATTRYYRLKQIDFDGTVSYSNVEAVKFTKEGMYSFSVFPNPVVEDIIIEIDNNGLETVELNISDLSGKIIKNYQLNIPESGLYRETISLGHELNDGVYIVSLTSGDYKQTKKIIKSSGK